MKATLLSQHCIQKKQPLKLEVIKFTYYNLFVKKENVNIETEWEINNLNHLQ